MTGNEEFWEDLLGHIGEQMLVPFVGPDLLTMDSASGSSTLWARIAERIAERFELTPQRTGGSPLNDVVRTYLAEHDRTGVDRLYRLTNDLLHELAPAPPEPVRQLAAISDIRVFVSTTFDSLLAQAVNDARFGGQRLTRELWFSPNQSTEQQQANARAPGIDETVVFKLFGQASSIPQFALHDEDVLEWLHSLLTERARLPDWLSSLLRNRPLLFVGCRVSDWVGRLLVRMASNSRLSLAPKNLFLVGEEGAGEASLTDFLRTYCGGPRVQVLPTNPAEFVAELHRRWTQKSSKALSQTAAAPSPGPRGSIFISYAREDVDAARRLRDAVERLGGDTWLDERRLLPGDDWKPEIARAIERDVRLMLAVLSQNTERRERGYVFREWQMGLELAPEFPTRRFVVPAVVDLVYDGHPERFQSVPPGFPSKHFGHAPGGEPDQQLTEMLRQEIRAMRREGPR